MVDNLAEKVHECPLNHIVCVQLGPWKQSVIRSRGVSTIQGLLSIEVNGRDLQNCPLYHVEGCPLLRGVRCWGVSVKRGSTVVQIMGMVVVKMYSNIWCHIACNLDTLLSLSVHWLQLCHWMKLNRCSVQCHVHSKRFYYINSSFYYMSGWVRFRESHVRSWSSLQVDKLWLYILKYGFVICYCMHRCWKLKHGQEIAVELLHCIQCLKNSHYSVY